MTIILLLYHLPRDFIILLFSYNFSFAYQRIWEYMMNNTEVVWRVTNSKNVSQLKKLRLHNVKICKRVYEPT